MPLPVARFVKINCVLLVKTQQAVWLRLSGASSGPSVVMTRKLFVPSRRFGWLQDTGSETL